MSQNKNMRFQYEHQMTKPTVRWLESKGLHVKREFPTPWGICDLVGCSFNKQNVKIRIKSGQKNPIGSHFRVLLLNYIPDSKENEFVSFENIYKEFKDFFDESYIGKELQKLKRDKFIEEVRPQCFHKLNGWYPLHNKIIAVELKLKRISEVLSQAQSNLAFAEESYVGLPIDKARSLFNYRKEKQLLENGIGILGIGHNKVQVLLRSKYANKSNHILKMHCAERFWRDFSTKGT